MANICRDLRRLGLGLAVAGIALLSQPAAARCVVAPDDFQALQLSKSGLKTQAEVDALPASSQQMVCSTRALWKRVHSSGDQLPRTWPDDEPGFSPSYMSPDELRLFNKLEDDWVDAQMAADQSRHTQKVSTGKAH
jgi:hypothetical protein